MSSYKLVCAVRSFKSPHLHCSRSDCQQQHRSGKHYLAYASFIKTDPFLRKSLCFQLPAMIDHGITIVISPLLALMNNQVAAMRAASIPVATINSNTLQVERDDIYKDLCCGMSQAVFP